MKVIAAVLVLLAGWETVCRLAGPNLDYDRRHIHAFPDIISRLDAGEGPRVLLLGNSLMMHGTKTETVRTELEALRCRGMSVERITPVGTTVLDWHYLLQRYAGDGDGPELIVVGFGPSHLDDNNTKRLPRLARHFTAWRSMYELFAHDITGFDDRCQIVLARSLAMFGDQLLWQEMVGNYMTPDFQEGTRQINRTLDQQERARAGEAGSADDAPQPAPQHNRVRRMIRLLRGRGSRVVFVAFPADGYELPAGIAEAIEAEGARFIDARGQLTDDADDADGYHPSATTFRKHLTSIGAPGLFTRESDYRDGYHLSETSAEVFSKYIASLVRDELAATETARKR